MRAALFACLLAAAAAAGGIYHAGRGPDAADGTRLPAQIGAAPPETLAPLAAASDAGRVMLRGFVILRSVQ